MAKLAALLLPFLATASDLADVCVGPACEAEAEDSSLLQRASIKEHDAVNVQAELRSMLGAGAKQHLFNQDFVPYFNYDGDLKVSGHGTIVNSGELATAAQTLNYELSGVDPECADGPAEGVGNSCGIHIHAGKDCSSDALGHYWNKDIFEADPWKLVTYRTTKQGTASVEGVKVFTGLPGAEIDGHTLIVHSSTGARIACSVIEPSKLVVTKFTQLTDSFPDIQGGVMLTGGGQNMDAYQTLSFALWGLQKKCASQSRKDETNSCSIQILGGTCGELGEALYNTETNPWPEDKYCGLFPFGKATVVTGLNLIEVMGNNLVIYDYDGKAAACGVIQPPKLIAPAFVPYFNYEGSLQVSGTVTIEATETTGLEGSLKLSWDLSGVDPFCAAPRTDSDPKNSCGVHVHTGTSCAEDALGHYWNKEITTDPWLAVSYVADGGRSVQESAIVVTGNTLAENVGRAFVVHDHTGARVGCGILSIA